MSLGWSKDSNIYSNFQAGVQKQLDTRKAIVEKKVGRTDKELVYLNSTTGWVKLSSGVDKKIKIATESSGVIDATTTILARENVLFGGAFNDTTKKVRGGLDTSGKNINSSYGFSEQYGFRPMAGITAAKIKTQGTFGAIKRATIEFQVNSLEDLEKFEGLYMLPGYSVLLEWGHSMILNNKGKLDTLIKTYQNYFINLPQHDPEKEDHRSAVMLEQLENLRKSQDFNYDALLGKVSNYTWSLNPEGTYSCQIDITGYGELAESLSALFTPKQSEDEKQLISELKINRFDKYLESVLNLYPKVSSGAPISTVEFELSRGNFVGTKGFTEQLTVQRRQFKNYILLDISNSSNVEGASDASCSKFITLGSYLNLINNNFMLQEDGYNWIKFYVGNHQMPFKNEKPYKNETPFITFDDHISSNIDVCFLPKKKSKERKLNIFFAESRFVDETIQGDTDDILNIMVNVSYLKNLYSEYIKKNENKDINVYDMVKELLDSIAKSLGNINNFSLESKNQVYYINDRGGTPGRNDIEYTLDLFGIKGLTTNVSLQSSIPSSLSTLIAIGASAGGSTLNENIFNFQSFYRNHVDRIIPRRDIDEKFSDDAAFSDFTKEDNAKAKDAAKVIGKYIRGLNQKQAIPGLSTADLVQAHQIITNLLLKKKLIEDDHNAPGVIPIQLSFEMKGISGLRITDVFNISPGLLPSRYKNNVSFTITGIDNEIANNRWTTTISAVMMVTTPLKEIIKSDIDIEDILESTDEVYPEEILEEGFPNATKVRNLIANNFSSLFSEKGTELTSSGRDIAPNTARLANFLMNDIFEQIQASPSGPTNIRSLQFRWTGGNDSFHVYNPSPPGSTKHRSGLGLDLAIQQNYTPAQLAAATKIVKKASTKAKTRYFHIFKDEYKDASGHATGGHWHFGLGSAGSNEVSSTDTPVETKEVSLDQLSSKATSIGIT